MNLKPMIFSLALSVITMNSSAREFEPTSTTIACASHEIAQWSEQHLATMGPAELQLLANALYITYALGRVDYHIRGYRAQLIQAALAVKKMTEGNEFNAQLLARMQQAMKILYTLCPNRKSVQTIWQGAVDYVEKHGSDNAQSAFQDARTIVQDLLATFVTEINGGTTQLFQANAEIHAATARALALASGTFKQLAESTNDNAEVLSDYNTAHRINPLSQSHAINSLQAALQTELHFLVLLDITNLLFTELYKQTYQKLAVYKDTNYQYIMFNEDGFINPEDRTDFLTNES